MQGLVWPADVVGERAIPVFFIGIIGGNMSFQVIMEQLAGGLVKSIEIFALTLLFSLPLGLLVSFGRMSKNRILRSVVWVYIRGLLCRDLPVRHRIHAARTV